MFSLETAVQTWSHSEDGQLEAEPGGGLCAGRRLEAFLLFGDLDLSGCWLLPEAKRSVRATTQHLGLRQVEPIINIPQCSFALK